ncbi:MAG: ThuA domain-containing protein [Phycisphaerae bacterium]
MWRGVLVVLTAVAVVSAISAVAQAGDRGKTLSEDQIKKITEAMPTEAPAKPAKPRKVLVYSKCGGFWHGDGIVAGNKAFEIMGAKTGAFEAVVSDDLSNFEADKLKEFDGIILNNPTGELLKAGAPGKPRKPDPKRIKDPARLKQAEGKYKEDLARYQEELAKHKDQPDRSEELRKNLMDWVKSGKAVIGTHAATDCSYKWKEYGEMIGGYFAGHPWHQLVPIKNDDPSNPINAAFESKDFEVTDEIYQFNRGVYSREKQRTLLSLDMTKLKKKGSRKDDDNAISWVKMHGQGRVFYCSLGHRGEIFWNPVVLKHYLAGIQWALGDLTGVETAPNPLGK